MVENTFTVSIPSNAKIVFSKEVSLARVLAWDLGGQTMGDALVDLAWEEMADSLKGQPGLYEFRDELAGDRYQTVITASQYTITVYIVDLRPDEVESAKEV